MRELGFDSGLYMKMQTDRIYERISGFNNKLYLEFGGKLFEDFHAARVLPGYDPDCKIKLMLAMKDITEIIMCVSAIAIEQNKLRADFGITYDVDAKRQIDRLIRLGLKVNSVVITRFQDQPSAIVFKRKLENLGIRVYTHRLTKGYPNEVETIISPEGCGQNPYIETTRPLVLVTAPGPGCGKLATCLSQLYHEDVRGIKAGYAKFETFPIWNLPLKHPLNLAYEAATADLRDINMIDPYHFEAYGQMTVNYNRDIEIFPVVRAILEKIGGKNVYKSPTDMGVNMAGYAISDDGICRRAARQEILRRYFKAGCEAKQGLCEADVPGRIEIIMRQIGLDTSQRSVVEPARERSGEVNGPVMAIELQDGRIVTGRHSKLMTAPAAAVFNAVKILAGLPDEKHLLSPEVLGPILGMQRDVLRRTTQRLNLHDALTAMSICAVSDENVKAAMEMLPELSGCEAHSTIILTSDDEHTLARMGMNLTCDPEYIANGR